MTDEFILDLVSNISARVLTKPDLSSYYDKSPNSPVTLIADFEARGVAKRGHLTLVDLEKIARRKNGEKLSNKTLNALRANGETIIKQFTGMAFASDDPEFAVRVLMALDGVRLPTASCILAWTLPHKWPVIDRRSWQSISQLSSGYVEPHPVGGLKVQHWKLYTQIVQAVSVQTKLTPQQIDLWLYAYDKNTKETAGLSVE